MRRRPTGEHDFDRPSVRRLGTTAAIEVGHGRVVAGALGAFVAILAAVLALNVVVDPYALAGTGIVPPAVENDRAVKLTLIEKLRRGPEALILGSSRSRLAEPAYLQGLTGRTGFNAGVTGGTAADAYVFARYAAERFPHERQRYVWFVGASIATNGVNAQLRNDPRAWKYLHGRSGLGLEDLGTYLSSAATWASLRVLRKCVLSTCRARIRFRPDGSIPHGEVRYLPEHTRDVRAAAARLVAAIRAHPPAQNPTIDPKRYTIFEQTLAFMNSRGERPLVVLNPVYPTVFDELEKYGYPERKAGFEYLRRLHQRFDFVVVDCQDIHAWGGTESDWVNPTHVNWRNMRRMLRYVVRHSDGALR